MDRRKVDQSNLARAVGVSEAAVSKWCNGGTVSLSAKSARLAARFLCVRADWLNEGIGHALNPDLISDMDGSKIETISVQPRKVRIVGVVNLMSDGSWSTDDLRNAGGELNIGSEDSEAYAVKVVGDAMHPRIRSGEFVVAEPGHGYGPGDEVVVVTTDGRAMVKEFLFARDGQIVLHSVNDSHGRTTLQESEVKSIHYVVAIVKSDRAL